MGAVHGTAKPTLEYEPDNGQPQEQEETTANTNRPNPLRRFVEGGVFSIGMFSLPLFNCHCLIAIALTAAVSVADSAGRRTYCTSTNAICAWHESPR